MTATVSFTARVPTYFMGIIGFSNINDQRFVDRQATRCRLTSIST